MKRTAKVSTPVKISLRSVCTTQSPISPAVGDRAVVTMLPNLRPQLDGLATPNKKIGFLTALARNDAVGRVSSRGNRFYCITIYRFGMVKQEFGNLAAIEKPIVKSSSDALRNRIRLVRFLFRLTVPRQAAYVSMMLRTEDLRRPPCS